MEKIILLLLVVLPILSNSVAQEKVMDLDNAFIQPNSFSNESYALPNQKNGDLMLIFDSPTALRGILFDENYNEKVRIEAKPLPPNIKDFIAYSEFDGNYSILFANSLNTKFGILQYNTTAKKCEEILLDFKLKKEDYIESVVYENQIYLFTVNKGKSSNINIYIFDKNFNFSKKTLFFENFDSSKQIVPVEKKLSKAFFGNLLIPAKAGIQKIEPKNPNVLETTSNETKLYQYDNKVILSFDKNPDQTDLFTIDLKNISITHSVYPQHIKDKDFKKSNSYIFEKMLFQIASSNKKMTFQAIDMENDKILKKYTVHKDEAISFKNSSIIQEGGGMFDGFGTERIREMEKTAKFLRKISSGSLGISVYRVNQFYHIVLGGIKEMSHGGGVGMFMNGGLNTSFFPPITTINTHFNPTFSSFYNYTTTKSTYINCLFDKNLEHMKGDIPLNKYDLLNEFEESLKKPLAINVFMHQGVLHYNYLDHEDGIFRLFRFE